MTLSAAERLGMLDALKRANGGDAVFRPSSASRWLKCVGSTQLAATAPKERRSSDFAREGTAAHFVAQQALEGIRQPDEWTDRMVQLDEKGLEGCFVDEEMVEKVNFYVSEIYERMTAETIAFTEQKMTLGLLAPDEPLWGEVRGTGDRVHVIPRKKIEIIDLKYGRGVPVPANSPQLKVYGLMALIAFNEEHGPFDEIEMVIVQPRLPNERDWVKPVTFDPGMLMSEFLGEVAVGLEAALEPNAPLTPGDHCRWCPAKTICPAIQQRSFSIAKNLFSPIDETPVTAATALVPMPDVVLQGEVTAPWVPFQEREVDGWALGKKRSDSVTEVYQNPAYPANPMAGAWLTFSSQREAQKYADNLNNAIVLPQVKNLDPGEISTILDRRAILETWIKGIEERAVQLLEFGTKIPGYKLVQRTGNRRYKAEEKDVVDTLRAAGAKVGEMYVPAKLLSPAQMEKLLPKGKRDVMEDLVERPLGAHTLVKDDDKRPALASGFTPIAND